MNDAPLEQETTFARIRTYRLVLFITGSIVISLLLVMIGLGLYNSSGTEQLDLSRPGLAAIRTKVTNDDTYEGYPSTGPLDKQALDDFSSQYEKELKDAKSVDSFASDVLSPKALQINK